MLTLHRTRLLTKIGSYLYLVAVLIFTFLPILWMISSAFKPIEDLFVIPPQWIPTDQVQVSINGKNYFLYDIPVNGEMRQLAIQLLEHRNERR